MCSTNDTHTLQLPQNVIVNGMSSYFYFSTLAVPDTVADIKVMSDKKMKKKRHIKCNKIWKGDTCVMHYM